MKSLDTFEHEDGNSWYFDQDGEYFTILCETEIEFMSKCHTEAVIHWERLRNEFAKRVFDE